MNMTRRSSSWELYDWLLGHVTHATHPTHDVVLQRVMIGLQWTVTSVVSVPTAHGTGLGASLGLGLGADMPDSTASPSLGLCFSPVDVPRTLPWPGTLVGRSALEVSEWLRGFDAAEASVALSTLNAVINTQDNACSARAERLNNAGPQHLRVFSHFAPQLSGAKVVVVGRYPGLERVFADVKYTCLERRPSADTLPDTACEYVLPEADFVFLTASAIANKSLPRLLELSQHAIVVLMGPSLPWLADWADFGVDFLAGVVMQDSDNAWQVAAEGGGTRLFDSAVDYRLLRVS